MQIELKEGQIAIVIDGLQAIDEGPHAGERHFKGARVFVGGEQVSLLRTLELHVATDNVVPRVVFDWGTETSLLTGEPNLRPVYQANVDRLKKQVPWAAYVSPIESYDPWAED